MTEWEEDYLSPLQEGNGPPDETYDVKKEALLMLALQDTVQKPPPGLFRYSDLHWLPHRTTGKGSYLDSEIAVIPWNRLEDFVQGEEQNPHFPCKFNRRVERKNTPGSLALPRACSPSQIIRYHCAFGPEDKSNFVPKDMEALLDSSLKKRKKTFGETGKKRKGKKVVPEYNVFPTVGAVKVKRNRIGKTQTGKSIKRGCLCCFYAKQPYTENNICQLIYRHADHSNAEGHAVHGVSVAGFKDSLGSTLSAGMKQHLSNLLWLGLSPSQVMAQHKSFVKDLSMKNGSVTRDTFVQPQDVRNLAKVRNEALWQKNSSDPQSVKMWVDENPDSVFCYKEHGLLNLNNKKQDDTPFTLGIQTPWQLQMLMTHGHNSALSFDATFGTSETRYPLYTVMVFDEWRNGIPVAFFVISQAREKDLQHVLLELQKRVEEVRIDWKPSSIIVDNAQAEINVLQKIWPQSSIFLCLWHVRKCWRENAVKKISTIGERSHVLNALGDIMYGKGLPVEDDPVHWAQKQLDLLTAGRPKAARFMKYMKKHWRDKACMWCISNRRIPHAGQNTNAAIESYHGNLKNILKSSRQRFDGRRLDWLIYHLVGDVVTHYWYAVHCKLFGFVRNKNQERIVATAIVRARAIPDVAVRIFPDGEDIALVASLNHRPNVWTIHGPDSEWAQCDCPVGLQGMICKHTMKVFRILHPELTDGLIVSEAGSSRGVNKVVPLSQSFQVSFSQSQCTQSAVQDTEFSSVEMKSSACEDTGEGRKAVTEVPERDPKLVADAVFRNLVQTAEEHPHLFDFLISDLRTSRGKQNLLIARGVAGVEHPQSARVFHAVPGDNSLKRYRSFLEPKSRKASRTRA